MLPSPRQLTCAVLYIFFYGNVRTTIQVVQCDFVQSTSFQSLLGLGVCCAVLACCLSQLCLIKLFQAFFFFFCMAFIVSFLSKSLTAYKTGMNNVYLWTWIFSTSVHSATPHGRGMNLAWQPVCFLLPSTLGARKGRGKLR